MLNIRTLEKMPYANAKVYVEDNGNIALISYRTTVAVIDNEGWLTVNGTYSATTRKHLSAFMHEYGNGYGYYDAKSAYLNDYALNLNTGEKMLLAIPIDDENEIWQRLEEMGDNPIFFVKKKFQTYSVRK